MMVEENENIDQLFREKLWNIEETPPPRVWDNIEIQLGHKKKNRSIIPFLKVAAGILLIVSLGLGYYFIQHIDAPHTISGNEKPELGKDTNSPVTEKLTESKEKDQVIESNKQTNTTTIQKENTISSRVQIKKPYVKKTSNNEPQTLTVFSTQSINTLVLKKDSQLLMDNSKIKLDRQASIIAKIPSIPDQEKIKFPFSTNEAVSNINVSDNLNITERESEKPDNPYKEWIIGGQVAPLYAYREISTKNLPAGTATNINKAEEGVLSYAGGLNVKYSASKRLSFQSGLYYTKLGQTIHTPALVDNSAKSLFPSSSFSNKISSYDTYYLSDNNVGNYAYFGQTLSANRGNMVSTTITASQYYEYLEIPLILRYKVIDKTIDFNILGGISTNVLIKNHLNSSAQNAGYYEPVEYKLTKINYSGSIGIGIEYPISSRFIINMEPIFKYYINSINENSLISKYPYTFGIYTGMSYVF